MKAGEIRHNNHHVNCAIRWIWFIPCLMLYAISLFSHAASMEITASFTPSVARPENNAFTNTTPQSGYCKNWPGYCPTGVFSILLPLTTTLTQPIKANDVPRNNPYFGLPSRQKTIPVRNTITGEAATVLFRVNGFSASFARIGERNSWVGGSFVNAGWPCQYSGLGVYNSTRYAFLWKVPDVDDACYKISTVDRTEPSRFYDMSFSYDLITPDPLRMDSGIYKGTLQLSVGPGGDIDFGDIYQASDSVLDINFTLTVTHELKLTTTASERSVSLQPCTAGNVCSADEGKANWERWMVTQIPPQLTGRSAFQLTSSGGFTIYLSCAEQIGTDCALKSDNSAQLVPVKTMVTLPSNVVDGDTRAAIVRRPLQIGKVMQQNRFYTKSYGEDRPGQFDFLVNKKDVALMLKTRPDSYRGTVTVIFDPDIY